ncbi:hypothetical protein [Paenibacillus glycanilyticus]|nr:hypothetical protein [Paenibacillus glycanilyticus]
MPVTLADTLLPTPLRQLRYAKWKDYGSEQSSQVHFPLPELDNLQPASLNAKRQAWL